MIIAVILIMVLFVLAVSPCILAAREMRAEEEFEKEI